MHETVMTNLKEDVTRAVIAQVKRYDDKLGRRDNSGHETYARVKECLELVKEDMKPLDKTLGHVWEEVVRQDKDTTAAMLREMLTETERALGHMVCLAAMVTRGLYSTAPEDEEPAGQVTMDELTEVDEATGEVMDGEEDPACEAGEE